MITVVLGRQKTKLKLKQISHNVNIHCVSPCDSLPPSGEHALSPSSVRGAVWCKTTDKGGMWLLSLSACLPPTLGAAITPWKRVCSGGWVWEKPWVVPFLGQQRGCSGETYGQRLQGTSNMADRELQIYQSLKTQQSSTCIPWICGILWRMATTRFQLNTLYFLSLYCVLVCLSVLPEWCSSTNGGGNVFSLSHPSSLPLGSSSS